MTPPVVVAVFGSNDPSPTELEAARLIAAAVVAEGATLLTGGDGSDPRTVKDAAIVTATDIPSAEWIGVLNRDDAAAPVSDGNGLLVTPGSGHRRNFVEACLCDAAIAIGHSDGTSSEALFAMFLRRPVILVGNVFVLAVCLTWAFFSMRAVMEVGGACSDGGPYVSAQPCPDGAGLIAIAIPVMIITAMWGSSVALSVSAPNLLIPMWGVLFGSLGWNFLEFAVTGPGLAWGWLVCGVLFELMALPALLGILAAVKNAVLPPPPPLVPTTSRWWVPAYAALGSLGFLVGGWSFAALS